MKSIFAQNIASAYCYEYGFMSPTSHYVENDDKAATEIAALYSSMPLTDYSENVITAYTALEREVRQQYQYAVDAGMKFEAWTDEGQPYASSTDMIADVENNHHMWFFTGGDIHPLLGDTNNLFRAIHDLFGHACEGFQFGPRGEHNAWIHHSMMFSRLAQKALTTETRGQNSWVNYGPNRALPPRERPFAEQKVGLLPDEYCDWYRYL